MSSIIHSKYVKTRKPHVCFGCAREFPKGTILNCEAVKDGKSVFTAYMCPSCEDVIQDMYPFDEFSFGALRDTVLEKEQEMKERENA